MTDLPKGIAGRPAELSSPADVVSQVLGAVRLTGEALFTCRLSEPWAVWSPPGEQIGPLILPSARSFAMFHYVASGGCAVEVEGLAPLPLEEADVVVLPRGDGHTMRGTKPVAARSVAEIVRPDQIASFPDFDYGGGGAPTSLVCGFLACGVRYGPLEAALPRLLRVRKDGAILVRTAESLNEGATTALRLPPDTANWFHITLRQALVEIASSRAGGRVFVNRLLELLFVQVLRSCVSGTPAQSSGWLAALADARVGPALAALHAEPARPWTLDALARRVGTSRSVLAERFTQVLGEPPIRYLARWRIQLARNLLLDTASGIAEVASLVGYGSEAAFSRMFTRLTGEPPTVFRARARAHP
jgi:AraC-like DNA-binding protein